MDRDSIVYNLSAMRRPPGQRQQPDENGGGYRPTPDHPRWRDRRGVRFAFRLAIKGGDESTQIRHLHPARATRFQMPRRVRRRPAFRGVANLLVRQVIRGGVPDCGPYPGVEGLRASDLLQLLSAVLAGGQMPIDRHNSRGRRGPF